MLCYAGTKPKKKEGGASTDLAARVRRGTQVHRQHSALRILILELGCECAGAAARGRGRVWTIPGGKEVVSYGEAEYARGRAGCHDGRTDTLLRRGPLSVAAAANRT